MWRVENFKVKDAFKNKSERKVFIFWISCITYCASIGTL